VVEVMRKIYIKNRKTMELSTKGELIMHNGQNIRVKQSFKQLQDDLLGQFKVLSIGSNLQYCKVKLPESWKIHPVFNIDLLEHYKCTDRKNQVIKIDAEGNNWVMDSITASGPSNNNAERHVILFYWKDYTHKDNTWKTLETVADNHRRLSKEDYRQYPAIQTDGRIKGVKQGRRRK
jgi:hypothetical protein